MPIYEYQCDNCGNKLEIIQKIDDDPLVTCPECQTDSLRKLVSAASFRLKGTGWYVTDFRDKPGPPAAGKGSPAATTKSDTKSTTGSTSGSKETSSSD